MDLRKYLFIKRLSIAEFSARINYHRRHINQIVLGNIPPSLDLAKKIEEATEGKVLLKDFKCKKIRPYLKKK